ncbi:hypothetical protein C2869_00820 [Saccharobesus litoralis]|uniref:Mannosyl-glycoprotein endo-beta-N-acetylglucosamidase-like domain-containing protein n=1 Tax=Saccharobesus litoralis TaxID=2172099 RepID=A0A2S0VLJ4_9ALTE|nr:glucosaminidase domain-containing protein [Saccharobesus litoralis]AWB65071.1 hypothetical protein C2869_00820 [Saccharobesus litoralis]
MNAILSILSVLTILAVGIFYYSEHLPFETKHDPQYQTERSATETVLLPDFSQFDNAFERKAAFIRFLTPLITLKNQETLNKRQALLALQRRYLLAKKLDGDDIALLSLLASEYDELTNNNWSDKIDALLLKINVIPLEIAIAQAAIDSGWGTSKFAVKGNNIYAQWCFEPSCLSVPSNTEAKRKVAKFTSVTQSIDKYFNLLNSSTAYHTFRESRAHYELPYSWLAIEKMIDGLENYSSKRIIYTRQVKQTSKDIHSHLSQLYLALKQ